MSDFFFKDRCFLCDFFSNVLMEASLSILTRSETFYEDKELLKVFSTVRFTGDLHWKLFSKNFKNIFTLIFCFFFEKMFSVEKDGFLLFPVGEEWFSRFMRIPWVFWRCKIDKILTIIFFLPLVLRMIFLIPFSSKVRNFLRKCLRNTASPLC